MGDHSSDTSPEETKWFSTDERSNLHIAKKIQDIQSWNTMIGNEDTTRFRIWRLLCSFW